MPTVVQYAIRAVVIAAILSVQIGASPHKAAQVMSQTLATYVRAHPHAMLAVGVIDHGREQVYFVRGSQATGSLDDRTQFQIGSITKLVTAAVLAQMVESGAVRLSDPVQRYLPAGVIVPAYRDKPITVLSLATHMSGLPGDPPNYPYRSAQAYSSKMLDDALAATKLTRAPGSKWSYSNFGFAVLGQALANTAGRTYDDLVKQRILDPLGMNDTAVTGSAATRRTMAPAFEYGGAPTQPESLGALGPAGSMESDLKDMMAFLKANLDLSSDRLGRELAFTQQPRIHVPEWNMAMGLAWQTVLRPIHRIPGDLGDLPPGWLEKGGNTDGYSSFIAVDHKSHSGVVAMVNVNDNDFQQVIAHAVSPRTAKMPVLWALVRRQPSPLSGKYVIVTGRRMVLDVFKYNGAMYVWIPAATTPSALRPIGTNRYAWDDLQVTLAFHVDANGHSTGLTAVQSGRTMQAKKIGAAPKNPPYDANWYLRPQRLIDVGGRRLNVLCTGTGSPTVILEAGLLADSAAWRLVQPAISRHTRVCSYDRAGLGFSDPTRSPRDAAAIVHDLHALLQTAGIAAPYVLVGWSSGGLYTRLYQYRYPNEVAGLVEVDPDSEFYSDATAAKIMVAVMHKPFQWYEQQKLLWYKQYEDCARNVSRGTCAFFPGGLAGYHKRLRAVGCPKSHPVPCALAAVRGEHLSRGSLWKDEALEIEAYAKSVDELRAARRPYGSLPLIVLTDSQKGDVDGGGPVSVAAQLALWVAKNNAEERVARLSSIGTRFVVAGSTHGIQLDHPSIVISAIDEVVDQARYRSHPH